MKKFTLAIFCAFTAVIIFFSVFGGAIRQSLYISVTTAKAELQFVGERILRAVPNEAVCTDIDGRAYVWILAESDDIGEKYFYAEKIFVEIIEQDEIYTGIRGITEDMTVIVTAASELQDKSRVKIRE